MERIRRLNGFKKAILLIMALMLLVFAFIYAKTVNRIGFLYRDVVLVPQEENGSRTYSGRIDGEKAVFTVSPDRTVTFQHGSKVYGPYSVTEDPSAVPESSELKARMRGVEIRLGEEVLFRGGMLEYEKQRVLYDEDGAHGGLYVSSNSGVVLDKKGNVIDPMAPTDTAVVNLAYGPELMHKGNWRGWFFALLLCLITAVLMLYEEELFRWQLHFRIRDPEKAEPSEWELASRYIGPVLFLLMSLVVLITGLQ